MVDLWVEITALSVLIGLSGFFSGLEVALVGVRKSKVVQLFNEGKKLARTGTTADCPKLDVLMDKIATLSLIPFVQGTMRYLYKTKDSASAKEAGELWAFASAILPFVHEVDPTAAEKLYKRAWKHDFTSDTYETIKTGIEGTANP